MKTLIIVGHPNMDKSLANKTIIDEITKAKPEIVVRNIAKLYPDYNIDAKAEQEELLKYDTIVFQYPFYWYNMPAILKHWFDVVFEYQFAYGSEGDKLKGKNFLASFTVGGPQESYTAEGYNTFEIPEFLKSMEQTANLAQMNYLSPIYSHGMVFIEGVYNTPESVTANAQAHSKRLLEILRQLDN